MYFAGQSPGHSPFGQWPFSPWSIRCSVQDQNFALQVPLVPAFRSRVCPSVWLVLDTIGHRSLHLFTSDGSPWLLSSSLFCLLLIQRLPDLLQRNKGWMYKWGLQRFEIRTPTIINMLCGHLVFSVNVKMLQSALLQIGSIWAWKPSKLKKSRKRKASKSIFFYGCFSI